MNTKQIRLLLSLLVSLPFIVLGCAGLVYGSIIWLQILSAAVALFATLLFQYSFKNLKKLFTKQKQFKIK